MSISKIKLTFLFSGLLVAVFSLNFFVASAQNSNSANAANNNQNSNLNTNQPTPTDKDAKEKDQTDDSEKKEAEPSPTPCDPESNLTVEQVYKDVKVTNAYKHHDRNLPKDGSNPETKTLELGDIVVVEVENLQLLLNRKECLASEGENKELVLFLDNRPLINTTQEPQVDPARGIIHFTLVRNEDTRKVWTYLLEKPRLQPSRTKVSIGFEDAYAINAEKDAFINLTVIPRGWSLFWLAVILIFLIGFLYLARKSNIIRSPGPEPGGELSLPYSLARTQAAWWFFIILASYLFIGVITGDFNTTITTTVLGLFGISAGTAVSSAFVDANKDTQTNRQKKQKEAEALESNLKDEGDGSTPDEAADKTEPETKAETKTETKAEKKTKTKPETNAETTPTPKTPEEKEAQVARLKRLQGISVSFFADILTDKDGISFHRFQAAALSIVLGLIFIYQVYSTLAMPEFSGTLLTLLLISSGTYLGFKLPQGN